MSFYIRGLPYIKQMYNQNYKEDMKYATKLNRWLLKPIGICFFFFAAVLYLIVDVQDIQVRLSKVGSLSFCVMILTNIKYCFNYMENDWKNVKRVEERQIMFEYVDFSRRLILVSAVFAFGGVIIYRVTIPVFSPKIVVGNISFKPLAYPISKVIMDTRQSPTNEIMICLQCFAGMVMSTITVSCCSMLTVSTMHACSQLKILMSYMNYLVTGRSDENNNVEERLSYWVQRHVRILSFISFIQQFLQNISLIEVLGCTLNMCMLEYYLIMGLNKDSLFHTLTYTILIISFAYNVFIFCYVGEILSDECRKVADVTYMIDWYRFEGRQGLFLILIIAVSSLSSHRLTAGKFIELSISSFGVLVKTSFAYLNMLRTVTS
ncbi:PREDICTED: odorant receptor 63a-like [Polistes canadensis]|uniref:odorant receptor 63a-like n=1 Tax=Polistes canadensis TaxID=91411 RepID=UPI000718DC07|nr:PREDICTED: odorant receptor 63a-like [Polistes canadensis]